jgi:hypothetical protein
MNSTHWLGNTYKIHTVISYTAFYCDILGITGWSYANMVRKKQKTQSIHALDGLQVNSHPSCVNVLQRSYLLLVTVVQKGCKVSQ